MALKRKKKTEQTSKPKKKKLPFSTQNSEFNGRENPIIHSKWGKSTFRIPQRSSLSTATCSSRLSSCTERQDDSLKTKPKKKKRKKEKKKKKKKVVNNNNKGRYRTLVCRSQKKKRTLYLIERKKKKKTKNINAHKRRTAIITKNGKVVNIRRPVQWW